VKKKKPPHLSMLFLFHPKSYKKLIWFFPELWLEIAEFPTPFFPSAQKASAD